MKKYERIILVDDNDTATFLNKDVVSEIYPETEVLIYNNSQEFLDSCFENTNWFSEPTLVLLDINMHGKFGFEVLEEIEEDREEFEEMEVIMVTSSSLSRDVEASTRFLCIQGFITKPLLKEKLQEVIPYC